MTRNREPIISIFSALLLAIGGIEAGCYTKGNAPPLSEVKQIQFTPDKLTEAERLQFLDGDFTIVKDVKLLPPPVLETLTEQGGSRLVIANPGKEFEVGDYIVDSSLPRRRLIFAGTLSDRCFIHYERGGRAHTYIVAFFKIISPNDAKPLWIGQCDGPAATIEGLRSRLANDVCKTDGSINTW
jgi:hypothetical protein